MIGIFPDGGCFTVSQPHVDNDPTYSRSPQRPTVSFCICGQRQTHYIDSSDLDAIANAGHRIVAVGLTKDGVSHVYGPR